MEPIAGRRLRRAVLASVAGAGALAATTVAVGLLEGSVGVGNASATYLLAVVAMAVAFGIPAAVATAIGSFVLYDLVFIQPTGLLAVADPEEWLNLLLLLVLGVVVGQLAGMQRARAEAALLRERQARALYRIGRALATNPTGAALGEVVRVLAGETAATRAWIALGPPGGAERITADSGGDGRAAVGAAHQVLRRQPGDEPPGWVRVHDPRAAAGTAAAHVEAYRVPISVGSEERGSLWITRPRSAGRPGRGDSRVLAAAADQVGQALERDRLAEEATSAEVARRSEAAKTALLDSVSHDLRTPLGSIRAAAGSLMDPAFDGAPAARVERAATIDREAERLNRLVSNLLDLSRIEAGDLRARPEPFALEDLVAAGLERLAAALAGRPVTVTMPDDLPPVNVDPVFIDQVLANLLENAAVHAAPGAAVRVGAVEAAPGVVRLTVEDGGPGVPDAALGGLFRKFSRVARGGPDRRGSGLGLAVVKGLVEAMGGRVAARRAGIGGLAIDVDLPAAPFPPRGDAGAEPPGVGA